MGFAPLSNPWLRVVALTAVLLVAGCATRRLAPGPAPDPSHPAKDAPEQHAPAAGGSVDPFALPARQEEVDAGEALDRAEASLAAGDLRQARRWALAARGGAAEDGRAALLLAHIYRQAVAACAGSELDFDDRLVYEMAARELDRVGSASRQAAAAAAELEDLLPTAEDRYYNHYELPRKECYRWLLE